MNNKNKCNLSTNTQSRFASVILDSVLGPPRLAQHTLLCPCFSVVPKAASHEARGESSHGTMKGVVSAQKALQESVTETRELLGGTEGNLDLEPS